MLISSVNMITLKADGYNPVNISYQVGSDGIEYRTESFKHDEIQELSMYNNETGELVLFVEIYEISSIQPLNLVTLNYSPLRSLVNDYDVFQTNWAYQYSRSMSISWQTGTTLAAIELLVLNFIGMFSIGLSSITIIATAVYNARYDGLYGEQYIKQNLFCSILRHEQLRLYTNSNKSTHVRTETNYGVWTGNPWDYTTAEYACRVLTERY